MDQCTVVLVGYEEVENLGLRYLTAYLRERKVTSTIVAMDRYSADQIAALIRKIDPKIVGFSLIFQRMVREFADLIEVLRNAGIRCHFTMGGHFPTAEPLQTLDLMPGLDSVVRCEGEETLYEIVERIDRPETWDSILGLTFRRNGAVVSNPARPFVADLDRLPFPDRQDRTWEYRGVALCAIVASRGCFHRCSFCSIRQFYGESNGPSRRSRSAQSVAQEIEQLFRDRAARIFIFEDDDIAMHGPAQKRWMEELLAELERRSLDDKVIWRISCRVDDLDAGLLERMMRAGLMSVYIGIESGSARGLATYHKGYSVSAVIRAVTLLERLALPFEFGFMLMNPESTFDSIGEDIRFLKVIGATGSAIVHFTKMIPYAGTPIARRLAKENRLTGGVVAPDYRYLDPRLELFQHFSSMAFHHRNFDRDGSVEMLRHAKFDAIVARKFFPGRSCDEEYSDGIRALIRRSNEKAAETLSLATRLMADRTEEEIFRCWPLLEQLAADERAFEREIEASLQALMDRFR